MSGIKTQTVIRPKILKAGKEEVLLTEDKKKTFKPQIISKAKIAETLVARREDI